MLREDCPSPFFVYELSSLALLDMPLRVVSPLPLNSNRAQTDTISNSARIRPAQTDILTAALEQNTADLDDL